jgi:hypothetical protein
MKEIKFKVFQGFKSWEKMAKEIAEFINSIGQENLKSISQSESHMGLGTFIVWYLE